MAFLFPGRKRTPTLTTPPGLVPGGPSSLLPPGVSTLVAPPITAQDESQERARKRPWWEFMPPGAEREAARARGEVGAKAGARKAARGVRRRAAASVGRTLLEGRPAGRIERFAITEKPQTEEAATRLAAYRERERKRKAKARAGKKGILRRPRRRKTVLR